MLGKREGGRVTTEEKNQGSSGPDDGTLSGLSPGTQGTKSTMERKYLEDGKALRGRLVSRVMEDNKTKGRKPQIKII